MGVFDALGKLAEQLIKFSPEVKTLLGSFAGPLALLLAAVALGVIFITVIRIVSIVLSSLQSIKEAK